MIESIASKMDVIVSISMKICINLCSFPSIHIVGKIKRLKLASLVTFAELSNPKQQMIHLKEVFFCRTEKRLEWDSNKTSVDVPLSVVGDANSIIPSQQQQKKENIIYAMRITHLSHLDASIFIIVMKITQIDIDKILSSHVLAHTVSKLQNRD